MPLGNTAMPNVDPSGKIVPLSAQQVAPAAPNLAERQAGGEVWGHRTLVPTDFLNGLASVSFSGPITSFSVLAPAGVPLWIGLDRPATSSAANNYDYAHPGTGLLSDRIPATTTLTISTGTGLPPGAPIEVHGYAGSYAIGS